MKHCYIVLGFLVPTDENSAETIQPTVRSFYHPTPRFDAGVTFQFLRLFASAMNVGGKAELFHQVADLVIVITFVHAHSLRCCGCWLGSVDRDTLQGLFNHLHVVAVGSLDGQADRDPVGVDQLAALDTALGPIGGIFACLFPPRAAPWSWSRPCSSRTSRSLPSRRSRAGLRPTSVRRPRLRPILGSDRAPWNQGKTSWRPMLSIDSRCAIRRRSHPCIRDPVFGADRHRTDECSYVRAEGLEGPPKDHQERASPQEQRKLPWPRVSIPTQLSRKQVQLHKAVVVIRGLSG